MISAALTSVEVQIAKAWPSAGWRSMSMVPMAPEAPPLFSTTTGWPSSAASGGAITRANMSVVPPGGQAIINRIGRLGHGACALASIGAAKGMPRPATSIARRFMAVSSYITNGRRYLLLTVSGFTRPPARASVQ